MAEPAILFLYDSAEKAAAGLSYQSEAARLGFHAVSADWRLIQPAPTGVVVLQGHEATLGGELRPVARRHFHPDVLVHRKLIWGQSEALVAAIRSADRPLCSYHPHWKLIGDKWTLESCFRQAERQGVIVPRPRTYLVEKHDLERALAEVGRSRPLIFKPSAASLCEGILLSVPADFCSVARQAARSRWGRYVVQDLVENGWQYQGRRLDLRLYALVTSFDPLRYQVLREGVARLAARESDPARLTDPLAVLTGCTYRRRRGVSTQNLTVSELLASLGQEGLCPDAFWAQAEDLLGQVFKALARSGSLAMNEDSAGCFYLAGTDVMIVSNEGRHSLLFLETNYVPDLAGWGAEVDAQLGLAHREWLGALERLQSGRSRPETSRPVAPSWKSWSRRPRLRR